MRLTLVSILILLSPIISRGQYAIENLTGEEYVEEFAIKGLSELGIRSIQLYIYPARYLPQYRGNPVETGFSDVEVTGTGRPDIYRVFLDMGRTQKPVIKTLLHELVHIAQHYENRLDKTGKHVVYNGQEYIIDRPYRLQPWEIEARRTSREIYKRHIN